MKTLKITKHEKKILDIVNNHPEILDNPEKRSRIAELYGLSEKTFRNRIHELKRYGVLNNNNELNITNNETINPKVIIHPKSIIGFIPLKTNNKKAHIVVKTL